MQKRGFRYDIMLFIKVNSKWTIDLYIKHKNIKLLKYKIKENLDELVDISKEMIHKKHNSQARLH